MRHESSKDLHDPVGRRRVDGGCRPGPFMGTAAGAEAAGRRRCDWQGARRGGAERIRGRNACSPGKDSASDVLHGEYQVVSGPSPDSSIITCERSNIDDGISLATAAGCHQGVRVHQWRIIAKRRHVVGHKIIAINLDYVSHIAIGIIEEDIVTGQGAPVKSVIDDPSVCNLVLSRISRPVLSKVERPAE